MTISDKKEDQGIEKAAITAKGMTNLANITGRNVQDDSNAVERNKKKALTLLELQEHNKHQVDSETHSGMVCEDHHSFTRWAMQKELKGEQKGDADDAAKEEG